MNIKAAFLFVIIAGVIASPGFGQLTSENNAANLVSEKVLQNLIPASINGWQRSSFNFQPRAFYDRPQGATVLYSKKDALYDIKVDLAYDFSERNYKRVNKSKQKLIQKLHSLKAKKFKSSNKTVYIPSQAAFKNIADLKFSVVKIDRNNRSYYIIRKKHYKQGHTVLLLPIFANKMAFRIRTCKKYDDNCQVKNIEEATQAIVSIIDTFDFAKLASLQTTPYEPPAIDVPQGFRAKYSWITNSVVGFAYPEKWTIKKADDPKVNILENLVVVKNNISADNNLLYKTIANSAKYLDEKLRLFTPDNVIIWFEGHGSYNWRPLKINKDWIKLDDIQIVQDVIKTSVGSNPGATYTVKGSGFDGHSLILKKIYFEEPGGRVFTVSILHAEKTSEETLNKIHKLLSSIIVQSSHN